MTGLVCQSFSRLNTEDRTSCPPSIVVESCEALLGRTGSITAVVHGVPKPHVTWHRHLGKLHTDRKYRVLSRDHVCCLRLRRVELADAGEYLCVATNPSGRETTQVILQVKGLAFPAERRHVMTWINYQTQTWREFQGRKVDSAWRKDDKYSPGTTS
ncbi:Myosin-binding protein C, cardiac-type [Branchiostoma belcheri]|nr:Myosin-binding protein C, cardiac-type [Branchiostoma belcheri]